MTLEKRCVTEEDMEAFTAFFAKYWGPNHILARDPAFARWQMAVRTRDAEAFGRAAVAGVAYFDGPEMKGFIGAMPMDFNIGGDVRPGAWLCNLLAAPETHAKGIGLKLMTAVHDMPVDIVGAVGINLNVIPMYRAMRYVSGPRVPRFIRVLNPSGFERLVGSFDWQPYTRNRRTALAPVRVETVTEMPPDWNVAWARIASRGYVGTNRDAGFVEWRYLSHPRLNYSAAIARDTSGQVSGLAVWRDEPVRDSDLRVGRLIELLALNQMSLLALAEHAAECVAAAGCIMIDHYSTMSMARDLELAGWWPETAADPVDIPGLFQPLSRKRRDMNYAVRFLRRKDAEAMAVTDICIVKSDGDQDRPN